MLFIGGVLREDVLPHAGTGNVAVCGLDATGSETDEVFKLAPGGSLIRLESVQLGNPICTYRKQDQKSASRRVQVLGQCSDGPLLS